MADGVHKGGRIETGELVCWWCGYGLDGVDLIRTDLKCPECGKDNVPGNGPEAPHVRRRWPRLWVLGAQVCWPGAVLGLGLGVRSLESSGEWLYQVKAGLTAMALPGGAFAVLWPPLIAQLIVDERVSGMHRRRWLLGVSFGGIAANGLVAAVIVAAARVLAEV